MGLTPEQAEELTPLAAAVATATLRRCADGLGWYDLRQVALLWAVAHPGKTREYLGHEDPKQGSKLLFTAMANDCMRATQKERALKRGYRPHDVAYYAAAQIRDELLPAVFDREAWTTPPQAEESEIRAASLPNERGGWITLLADVADAYRGLPQEAQQVLFVRYGEDHTVARVAEILGLTEEATEKRLERAVKAIHHKLGGDKPEACSSDCECRGTPAGGRRARSNAQMMATTNAEYQP